MSDGRPESWHPDPHGRHELRWWDGSDDPFFNRDDVWFSDFSDSSD